MMDKTYILDQGILVKYVLGELNEKEILDVEQALSDYPELRDHLKSIEDNFEQLALENAIEPSESVKSKLLAEISNSDPKVIPLSSGNNAKTYLRIAASVAAIFLVGSIYLYFEWTATQAQLKLVEDQNSELNNELDQLSKDFNETSSLYASINDPNTKKYILEGNALMPEAKLISYVNDVERSVVINTTFLPELKDDQDYQMWADVEGEMINMGVIDTKSPMLAMNYIDHSESLNITIEPAGGSDHPTVSQLITNIYIK
ncbi:MAG: anti-sigma factor [Psychroserpens sp.]|nr:anti-sigma factor [Psychroserpens sp.]